MLHIAVFTVASLMAPAGPPSHTVEIVEGWTVMVGAPLSAAPRRLKQRTMDKLQRQLKRVRRVLNPATLAELRRVVIWAERKIPGYKGLVYHPSAKWLEKHGYDPRKAGGVEITRAINYVIRKTTPWAIMHELAHAYHYQVLGTDHAEILSAYKRAKKSGKYQRVRRAKSTKLHRHYGMENVREFFAEMTETYLGQNDFQPFNRSELKRFDPDTYRVLHTIWGPRLRARKAAPAPSTSGRRN